MEKAKMKNKEKDKNKNARSEKKTRASAKMEDQAKPLFSQRPCLPVFLSSPLCSLTVYATLWGFC